MSKFNFTDEEFLGVVNMICELDAPGDEKYIPLTSMNESLHLGTLDSLSIVVFFIWISSLFGISESKMKDFVDEQKFTIQDIKNFVMKEATKTCSYEEAKEYIK